LHDLGFKAAVDTKQAPRDRLDSGGGREMADIDQAEAARQSLALRGLGGDLYLHSLGPDLVDLDESRKFRLWYGLSSWHD
jgi:hypothetical protein